MKTDPNLIVTADEVIQPILDLQNAPDSPTQSTKSTQDDDLMPVDDDSAKSSASSDRMSVDQGPASGRSSVTFSSTASAVPDQILDDLPDPEFQARLKKAETQLLNRRAPGTVMSAGLPVLMVLCAKRNLDSEGPRNVLYDRLAKWVRLIFI